MLFEELRVEIQVAIDRGREPGLGADAVADRRGIVGVIALDLVGERGGGDRLPQGTQPEVECPQPVELGRAHQRAAAGGVAEHHRGPDRQRFERRPPLGEDEIEAGEQLLGTRGRVAGGEARHREADAGPCAGLAHCRQVVGFGGVVAQHQGLARTLGQAWAGAEAVEVDEVGNGRDALGGHSRLGDHALARRLIHRHVAQQARKARRALFPGEPAVADEEPRHAREVEQGGEGLQIVMAVDQLGSLRERGEIVADRDARADELAGELADDRAPHHRPVAARGEGAGQLDDVQLGAGAVGEPGVGEEDLQRLTLKPGIAGLRAGRSTSASRAASGSRCSLSRITCG